jgi:hypothetical protein
MQKFKHESLSSARWRIDDYVVPGSQSAHRILLPQIGQGQLLKRREWERHEELGSTFTTKAKLPVREGEWGNRNSNTRPESGSGGVKCIVPFVISFASKPTVLVGPHA